MKNKIIPAITFAIGAGIGSVVTWAILKKKYEERIQKEVESVKETYEQFMGQFKNEDETEGTNEESEETDVEVEEYVEIIEDNGYMENPKKPAYGEHSAPHIIAPEELGDTDFEIVSLTYYDDGILADDWGNIQDIDTTIGDDALNHFGDYDDDAVCVRNHQLETDYEVLLEERTYSEVFDR